GASARRAYQRRPRPPGPPAPRPRSPRPPPALRPPRTTVGLHDPRVDACCSCSAAEPSADGWWAFCVLRQRIRDLVPRGLRADPDVLDRPDPGVVVEGAGRGDRVVAVLIDARSGRSAGSPERLAEEARSRKPT